MTTVALAFFLTFTLASTDAESPLPDPFAERQIPGSPDSLVTRTSPDGRWLAVALGTAKFEGSGWGYHGVVVYDLHSGKEHWRDPNLSPGRILPHFSADGRFLAWCEAHLVTGEEKPRVPTVVVRLILEDLTRERFPISTDHAAVRSPILAAIDPDGSAVAVRESITKHDEILRLYTLGEPAATFRFERFREPGFGRSDLDVTLTESHLIAHTRPEGKHGGADYRLVVVDRASEKPIAETGAYVSTSTPRYCTARNGKKVWNGTGEFQLVEIDTTTGEVSELDTVRDPLYSHFLELTLSPDERDLIAWSRERKKAVHRDLHEGTRRLLELDMYRDVIGIDARGRAWIRGWNEGLATIDLRGEGERVVEVSGEVPWALLDRTGEILVTASVGEEKKWDARVKKWRLRFHQLTAE